MPTRARVTTAASTTAKRTKQTGCIAHLARTVCVFEQLDVRLVFADFLAQPWLHAAR